MPEKFGKIQIQNQREGSFAKSPRGARGEPGGPRRPPGAAPPLAAPGGRLGPLGHLWLPPFAYLFSVTGKLRGQNPISQTLLCSAAAALPRSGAPEDLFPAPAGGRIG